MIKFKYGYTEHQRIILFDEDNKKYYIPFDQLIKLLERSKFKVTKKISNYKIEVE